MCASVEIQKRIINVLNVSPWPKPHLTDTRLRVGDVSLLLFVCRYCDSVRMNINHEPNLVKNVYSGSLFSMISY